MYGHGRAGIQLAATSAHTGDPSLVAAVGITGTQPPGFNSSAMLPSGESIKRRSPGAPLPTSSFVQGTQSGPGTLVH